MRRTLTVAFATLLLAAACGRAREGRAGAGAPAADSVGTSMKVMAPAPFATGIAAEAARADIAAPAPATPADATPIIDRDDIAPAMIIRTGRATIQADSLPIALAAVRRLAAGVGGYVANTTIDEGGDRPHSGTLEVKMPADRFDDALAGLRPIGKVEDVNVSAQDVGEEFVDVAARVDNARRLEQRLLDLLATRTGKLSDVLQVERELGRVRGEIERMEGRLRYLRAHAAVSTLTITVHEPYPVVGERGSLSVLAEAVRRAWRNFVLLVAGAIAALGTLLPLGAIVTGLVVLGLRWRRGRRARVAPAAS